MDDFTFSIDVPVRTEWSNIEVLRTSVQNCLAAVFNDVAGRDALAMVTGELLENAIKHGSWEAEPSSFRLRVWGDRLRGTVCVENPVRSREEARVVEEMLSWIAGFPSTAEAYQARLLEVASAPRDDGKSGLGLARVAYEGGCRIRSEHDAGTLRVIAEMDL